MITKDNSLVKQRIEGEADPLFQQFVRAIAIDVMKNPDKLHDAQDVWDHEWTDLLKGVDVEQE